MPSMMEQYKDLWISGHATPGYPGGNNSTPGATVLYQRPDNSVMELTKLNVHNFELENRELAGVGHEEASELIAVESPSRIRYLLAVGMLTIMVATSPKVPDEFCERMTGIRAAT